MMRKSLAYPAILLCLVFLAVDLSFAQSYTGTYTVANQQGGIITLTLRQDAQNAVLGTMSGNGVQFQVEGIVEEGVAVGAIYNEEGGVYFEAQLQGSQLLLSLFNVGPDNEPDYSNPTELVLSRQAGAAAPTPSQPPSAAPGAAPSEGGNPLGGGSTFAGSFVGEGISLQLQGTQGGYNGTLTFQGQSYPVQASATGGRLQGSFAAGGESYPFEAALQGESLTLVSAGNTYQLQRQSGGQGTANPLSRPGAAAGAANAAPGAAVSQPIPAAPAAAGPSAAAPGAGEVSDPAWGFAFTPPEGWKHQKGYAGAMLGHDRIAGLIIVLPHQSASLQELGAEMQKGMSEEGIYLAPAGQITQRGADVLTGEYSGNVQGEQARARGFGTLSPYGGGAYVVAVTTPEKYGSELQGAAEALVSSLRYVRVDNSALIQNFTATWIYISDRGASLMNLILSPDGSFEWIGETSFVYETPTDVTQGYSKDPGSRGRWTVRGSMDEGVIILTLENGEQREVAYRTESAGRYNRYLFDGYAYFRK